MSVSEIVAGLIKLKDLQLLSVTRLFRVAETLQLMGLLYIASEVIF